MVKISACVITKNEEINITNWLKCMKLLADEMIVVDTGSTDNTLAVAQKNGAKTYEIKWEDDFSSAKNFAIEQAQGEWIAFLDADEYFPETVINKVKNEIQSLNKNIDAVICKIVNVNADDNNKYISSFYNIRIFRNNKNLRYQNKVHEMLKKKTEQLNLYKLPNDIEIYHTGYSTSIVKEKLARNLKILQEEIALSGEQSWHLGFLCDCYFGLEDYKKTIEYAQKAIKSGVKLIGQENNIYSRLISAMAYLNMDEEALLKEINNAILKFPELPDFYMDKAMVLLKQKKYVEAEVNLENVLDKYRDKKTELLTNTIEGKMYLVYAYLGEIALLRNDRAKASEFFLESLQKNKYYENSLVNFYDIIKACPVEEIISFLNSLYDNSERDLKFLCSTLKKKEFNKVYLYYAYQLMKKYDNYEIETVKIENLLNNDNYEKALELIKINLNNNYQMLILNNILSQSKDNYIKAVLPEQYQKNQAIIKEKYSEIIKYISVQTLTEEKMNEGVNNKIMKAIADKKISIIIKNSTEDNLEICLAMIQKHVNINYEIIIISKDIEYLEKHYNHKLILWEERLVDSYNEAVKKSEFKWILFINDDAILTENCLDRLFIKADSNKVAAIGPLTNNIFGQNINIECNNEQELATLASDIAEKNNSISRRVLSLSGSCLLIRKDVFNEVQGLDNNVEENAIWEDLSFKIIMAQYDLILACDSFVYFTEPKQRPISFELLKEKWGFDFLYSNGCRHDLLNIMDLRKSDLNILEVGCACGGTLLEINNINKTANIYGIEINSNSAKLAKNFANVSSANIEDSNLPYKQGFFDYIIFGDVLEHLYNPQKVLENIKPYLKEDGKIIASIPNIQHWSIIEELLKGNWSYTDAGILDKTHLRFFTRNEITKLFNNSGYEVKQFVGKDIGLTETAKNMLEKLLQNGLIESFDDFIAYQWLVEATKNEREEDKKELVYLLRRIDNDINIDENINEVKSFIREKKIEHKILVDLINISLIKKVKVLLSIVISMYNNQEQESAIKILIEGYKLYNDNVEVVCTLAYLLNVKGERESAIKILENCSLEDENIEKLLHEIRGVQ